MLPAGVGLLVLALCLGLNWQLWRQTRAAEAQQVRAEFDQRARSDQPAGAARERLHAKPAQHAGAVRQFRQRYPR
ncbi:hypothetical protein LP420_15615 [Massilia sp. B-10]|nr:hypothetical protein LP420_15615 [Massilia sp. B-10]